MKYFEFLKSKFNKSIFFYVSNIKLATSVFVIVGGILKKVSLNNVSYFMVYVNYGNKSSCKYAIKSSKGL